MERRLAKVNISAAGGSAGAGAKTCKVTLPTSWLSALGIGESRREVVLAFDGEQIILSPVLSMEEYAQKKLAAGHRVYVFRYYDAARLCTLIYADFTDQTLLAENHTNDLSKTAFGKKTLPSWDDLLAFLEERCIPRGRANLQDYLIDIGADEYEPLEIIRKTEGRMAEDGQWLKVEVLK